ncbi:hypothetical protein FHL15_006931 [Xylaria flabelliformis]|uniref:Nephrocystin 3-like N-terminal domain-containing protein n=1 Tax=Xylaria flabelliformis TaxID=2512241 RepID=A0A553HVT6_9PEZI|nr:hypothetical protein FHL15_006931 [Xylaria flabelliformis]
MADDSLQDPATGSSPNSDTKTSLDAPQPATPLDPMVGVIISSPNTYSSLPAGSGWKRPLQLRPPQNWRAVSLNSNPPDSSVTTPQPTPIQGSSQPVPIEDQIHTLQLKDATGSQAKKEAEEREKERKKFEADQIQEEAVKDLRKQLKLGRLAICVGPDVTLYSAPSQAQRLSWLGLMNNALDYYENQASGVSPQPMNQAHLTNARKILQKSNLTEKDYEEVANIIQKLLSDRIDLKTAWLRAQFQNLYEDYVSQQEILDTLRALMRNGAYLFTTTYDDLLEQHCGIDSIDAADPIGLGAWQRGGRLGIFHPYGSWRNANHVVLSAEQYWRDNNQVVRETLQRVIASKTILFIGCGGNLSDPNFGPLIQWIGEQNAGTTASHYILLQPPESNPVTQLPLVRLRCEDFDAILRFLQKLVPRRAGTLSKLSNDRDRKRIHKWLSPHDQTWFLNDMINLQGPHRFDRQATEGRDVWTFNSPSRVLVTGERGWGKTMFCASVIQNTLKDCHLGTIKHKHARDSLAYFFCAEYEPRNRYTEVWMHDLNIFLRTVISQLTPPHVVFEPLRRLYTECTRYHPARLPTNTELQEVLIQIVWTLDKPVTLKNGALQVPGETYLVIDKLNALTPTMRDQYSRFIKVLVTQKLQHFHLLVAADDLVAVGVPPPLPLFTKAKGRSKVPSVPQKPGLRAADWHTITLDLTTTNIAMVEWIRDCFANNPSLAVYGNLSDYMEFEVWRLGENFRWVYWKLDRLGKLGTGEWDGEELRRAADDALGSDAENEWEDWKPDGDGNDAGDKGVPSHNSDVSDDDFLPGEKRPRKQEKGSNKRVKT